MEDGGKPKLALNDNPFTPSRTSRHSTKGKKKGKESPGYKP